MRKWQFDITESAQLLYCINLMILFTGYAKFISQSTTSTSSSITKYQPQYLIVIIFAIITHLLNSYNNFYT